MIHPATTTHSQLSKEELEDQEIKENTIRLSIGELEDQEIKENTIRLSIGTEHIDDIIEDLEQGFRAIGG